MDKAECQWTRAEQAKDEHTVHSSVASWKRWGMRQQMQDRGSQASDGRYSVAVTLAWSDMEMEVKRRRQWMAES